MVRITVYRRISEVGHMGGPPRGVLRDPTVKVLGLLPGGSLSREW